MTSKHPGDLHSLSANEPLWFKDAVIYQLHVREFSDSNGEGIGDFQGLTGKLDDIQSLGVTAIWLLPFFLSPLRDDGYDIADYTRINPIYGSLRDFETFLREAHQRDLRVITEMVLNHTSDQHEWFQKSRRAKPGDKWREFYVWSDTDERYRDARIILQDFEKSNWTWDPEAQAYYWHRFYHHQPDLNFDNPDVHEAMFQSIDFWLDRGVDGVRLDAVPYLYEREGTGCENLPETHAFLKKLRNHVDQKYSDRMLLAEANLRPEDAAAYFGDGNECHMNFLFPLMPRLFMAIEREDRFPIIDILEQTPQIPENCQWGICLGNHVELTPEMVTDEERDDLDRTSAEAPRARVNPGIYRRQAPLMRDDRLKMELMNCLLLSLPGTPVIYYGDEICLGDNIDLGDRDGVQTPMLWNDDRNAGFSRVDPPRLIGLRKQHPAFGRGTIETLMPENGKVLAFLRTLGDETLLIVANLSRSAQSAELDLSRFRGRIPVELFGHSRFPPIGELPYCLNLGPFAFYWFRLEWSESEADQGDLTLPTVRISGDWDSLFSGNGLSQFESALPSYLARHRWFAGKSRTIQRAKLIDVIRFYDVPEITREINPESRSLNGELASLRILLVEIEYTEGEPETYQLPVVFAQGVQERNILADRPATGLMIVRKSENGDGESATLCDTSHETEFWLLLFDAITQGRILPGLQGGIEPLQTSAFSRLAANVPRETSIHGGEQSNTSAILGRRLIMKLFRRIGEGENPDLEIGRYLTEKTRLACVPQVAGALEYRNRDGNLFTVAVLHEFVANQGDAWTYTLDQLNRYLERIESEVSGLPSEQVLPASVSLLDLADRFPPTIARNVIGSFLASADLLGTRTAELHQAFAAGEGKDFAPDPFTRLYQRSLYQSMRDQTQKNLTLLKTRLQTLPDSTLELAEKVTNSEDAILEKYLRLSEQQIHAHRLRCHGDFHLGQVLFTGKDFVIVDFEGEPARTIGERRIKTSPLKDVAGMIRSFHYASHSAFRTVSGDLQETLANSAEVQAWLAVWYAWSASAYLKSYLAKAVPSGFLPDRIENLKLLLDCYMLEKAVYELGYELNNRPDWVRIPLEGILQLLDK